MSYCRFGADSDVYVYPDINGGITCCGCTLETLADVNLPTRRGMLAHLQQHRRAGHKVPERATERLANEIEAAPLPEEACESEEN